MSPDNVHMGFVMIGAMIAFFCICEGLPALLRWWDRL